MHSPRNQHLSSCKIVFGPPRGSLCTIRHCERQGCTCTKWALQYPKVQCAVTRTCVLKSSANERAQAIHAGMAACTWVSQEALCENMSGTYHSRRITASGRPYQGPTCHRHQTCTWQARVKRPVRPDLPASDPFFVLLLAMTSVESEGN